MTPISTKELEDALRILDEMTRCTYCHHILEAHVREPGTFENHPPCLFSPGTRFLSISEAYRLQLMEGARE